MKYLEHFTKLVNDTTQTRVSPITITSPQEEVKASTPWITFDSETKLNREGRELFIQTCIDIHKNYKLSQGDKLMILNKLTGGNS